MSRDVKQYWQELRAIQATLPEYVWLTGTNEVQSVIVSEASALSAARLLLAKSHRIATEAEVSAHLGNEQEYLRLDRIEQQRREGIATVVVKRKK
jgi:hypothetical protein